jgi:hypothetical protein
MQHEGMVHALEEIHRLLEPGGILIDIHPFVERPLAEVHLGGEVLFSQPFPDYSIEDYQQAENALGQVIQRGLFFVERKESFEFITYSSSSKELIDYLNLANATDNRPGEGDDEARELEFIDQVDRILQEAGECAEVATHERVWITRLRAI